MGHFARSATAGRAISAAAASGVALIAILTGATPASAHTTASFAIATDRVVTLPAMTQTSGARSSSSSVTSYPAMDVVAKVDPSGAVAVRSPGGEYVPVAYRLTSGQVATFDPALRRGAKLPMRLPAVELTPVMPTLTHGDFAYNWVLDGQPMRFGTCQSITWTLDETNLRDSGISLDAELARWQGIFTEVSAITGYRFAYQATDPGLGQQIAPGAWNTAIGPQTAHPDVDILLAYRTTTGANAYPDLTGLLGLGGAGMISRRGGSWALDTSVVLLNATALKTTDAMTRVGAMRHELGHALGLGHVRTPGQVMGASGNEKHPTWQGGDVEGLRSLAAMPCPAA